MARIIYKTHRFHEQCDQKYVKIREFQFEDILPQIQYV